MKLAIYQPDIAQNAATLIRLVEPCGFVFSDRNFRRAGMDYLEKAAMTRHASWDAFLRDRTPGRIVLLTTKSRAPYTAFTFLPNDTLLLGRESAGVPDEVHARADARLCIPLRDGLRSLNVAVAGAMVLGEALRQTNGFPA